MANRSSRAGSFVYGLAGVLVGAMLITALPAGGATGDNMVLGADNSANQATKLVSTGYTSLKLRNNAANPPLMLVAAPGTPPLGVNSNTKVANLNADLLDGWSAENLASKKHDHDGRYSRRVHEHDTRYININETAADSALLNGYAADDLIRADYDATYNLDDGNGAAETVTIEAPRSGLLIMSGAIEAGANERDVLSCKLRVDGSYVSGSTSAFTVDQGHFDSCATVGAKPVGAGSHDVTLDISGWHSAFLQNASLWVIFVPFDGGGSATGTPSSP